MAGELGWGVTEPDGSRVQVFTWITDPGEPPPDVVLMWSTNGVRIERTLTTAELIGLARFAMELAALRGCGHCSECWEGRPCADPQVRGF